MQDEELLARLRIAPSVSVDEDVSDAVVADTPNLGAQLPEWGVGAEK
jgi:hypothetical protein